MAGFYFSDYFEVSRDDVIKYGAFDVSLARDLPLFIDPFLLFNSKKAKYQELHQDIIKYVSFLKEKADYVLDHNPGLLKDWFYFREVKQTWLGFTESGNAGHGLRGTFASALAHSFRGVLKDFGKETIPSGTHLEKVTLIKSRVGRDQISDFTTNLIKGYLAEYTQAFARRYIAPEKCRKFQVDNVRFNYGTGSWETDEFILPAHDNDYVLLTPRDILTRFDNWISRADFEEEWYSITQSIENDALRGRIVHYFESILPKKPTVSDRDAAITRVIEAFPEILDYYIRYKEQRGAYAVERSGSLVSDSERLFVFEVGKLIQMLATQTEFYKPRESSLEASRARVQYLKHVIEDQDGYKIFWSKGKPIPREADVQVMFKLCWYGTDLDVNAEVNNGRGPMDFKVSRGKFNAAGVEFKLAKNTQLKRNLKNQTKTYGKAANVKNWVTAIIFFSLQELKRVQKILKELGLNEAEDLVLIDARRDNKQPGSKV